jgi:hypothetical protein
MLVQGLRIPNQQVRISLMQIIVSWIFPSTFHRQIFMFLIKKLSWSHLYLNNTFSYWRHSHFFRQKTIKRNTFNFDQSTSRNTTNKNVKCKKKNIWLQFGFFFFFVLLLLICLTLPSANSRKTKKNSRASIIPPPHLELIFHRHLIEKCLWTQKC